MSRRRKRARRRPAPKPGWSTRGWLAGGVTAVTLVGALVALVFTLFPGAKPERCGGEPTAHFEPLALRREAPDRVVVSYTVDTHGFRGEQLDVKWSLFRAGEDGTLAPLIRRAVADELQPAACFADQGGDDLDVAIPGKGRYQVLLELFRARKNQARVDRRSITFDA